jgi:superfamily II DNA or RNA helicase
MKLNGYGEFLANKAYRYRPHGKTIESGRVNGKLFDWQSKIVQWAVAKGRSAIFADTGLGKTFIQLEWARLIGEKTLIIAPLSVARQTVKEAKKIGAEVVYCRHENEAVGALSITNYEMIEQFDPAKFDSVVLDESSILKNLSGKTRTLLVEMFSRTPYRLCCTATPAPNDQSEIGNHAEFLGICTMAEMLAMFFVHDEQDWRLKGHAITEFYRWLSSWSLSLRLPSDLGFDDDGFRLPKLNVIASFIETDYVPEGELFFSKLHGIHDRVKARESGIEAKLPMVQNLIRAGEQWIIWCGLNEEADALHRAIPGSINIQGSDDPETKAEAIENFQDRKYNILITKPKIGGFGLNLQNCHNMIFFGMSDSFESYYQSVRRCYRYGQKKQVNVHLLLTTAEQEVYRNVMNKEKVATEMKEALIEHVRTFERLELGLEKERKVETKREVKTGEGWTAILGDSCVELKKIAEASVHLSVYSPPFADLYTYSNLPNDLGNSKDWPEFFSHYEFIVKELLRMTMPGRLTAVHTADIPAMLSRNGYIGVRDFPGEVIRLYEKCGWIFHGRVTIDKNPQAQAIRTKSKALLFVQLEKDSISSRPAIADYVLIFRKVGENQTPVNPVQSGELTREMWMEWAHPIWYNIRETETLQYSVARDDNDEKHICPLQLDVIERCIKLWSNPDEVVLTPFGGIGSESYKALELGRRTILIELKRSYYETALQNLAAAESKKKQQSLFVEQE